MTPLPIPLENLTRRLAETPEVFFQEPATAALLNDLFWEAGAEALNQDERAYLQKAGPQDQRLFQLYHLVFWLLGEESLLKVPGFREKVWDLLTLPSPRKMSQSFLQSLASIVLPEKFKTDGDRREELVRLVLKALEVLPPGEDERKAQDRLRTLDSIERQRVVEETRIAAQRAREIEEALARKEAEEAASKYQRD